MISDPKLAGIRLRIVDQPKQPLFFRMPSSSTALPTPSNLPVRYLTVVPLKDGRALQLKHRDPLAVKKAIEDAKSNGEGHVGCFMFKLVKRKKQKRRSGRS